MEGKRIVNQCEYVNMDIGMYLKTHKEKLALYLFSKYKIENKIEFIYFSIMLIAIFSMIVCGYITHGESIRSLLHTDINDVLMDYYNSIQYGMRPYSRGVIYPPLINVVYGFMGRFALKNMGPFALRTNQLAVLTYLFYHMFSYAFFFLALKKYAIMNNMSNKSMYMFGIICLFTVPFIFSMERANSILLVPPCLMYYCCFYDSDNIKKRTLAMLLLGIAAAIKVVPAVFGLLYVRDRKWKNGVLALVIGMLIFNIPFILTDGNLNILIENIRNLTSIYQGFIFDEYGNPVSIGYGCYANLRNTIKFYSILANIDAEFMAKYINVFMFLASVYIITMKRNVEKWKVYTLLCGIMVLTPGFSAIYNLMLYIIPLIVFLEIKPKITKLNCIYLLSFIFIFVPVVNFKIPLFESRFGHDIYPLTLSTALESTSILLASLLIIFETGCSNFFTKREKSIGVIGIVLLCLVGYYQYNTSSAIKSFSPYQRECGSSLKGVALENGKYSYFNNFAAINLFSKDILENGLIINYDIDEDNGEVPNNRILKVFADNNIVASKEIVCKRNQTIFVSPEEIRKSYKQNTNLMSITLNAEAFNGKIKLNYAGPVMPLELIKNNQYYIPGAMGLKKTPNQNLILLEHNMLCLKNEKIAKHGLLFVLNIPMELIDTNSEKVEISLLVNNKFFGNYDVGADGKCVAVIASSNLESQGIDASKPIYLSFTSSKIYNEYDLKISLNKEKRICNVEYVGNPFNIVNEDGIICDIGRGKDTGIVFMWDNINIEKVIVKQNVEFPVIKINQNYSYCYIQKNKLQEMNDYMTFKYAPKILKGTNFFAAPLNLISPNITIVALPGHTGLFARKGKQYINYSFKYLATTKIKHDGISVVLDVPEEYNDKSIEVWYANQYIGNYVLKGGQNDIKIEANLFSNIESEKLLNILEFKNDISYNLTKFNGVEVISIE